ncbi:MAG: arginine deiminase family protein [Nitratireductor sp.]
MTVRFTRALVRKPPASVAKGLRAVDRGAPSYEGVQAEHAAYVAALERAGLQVETLAPLDLLPDSLFVEDPALVFTEGAILLRPGAPSRRREAEALRPDLAARFEALVVLPGPGAVDGGDVLVLGDRVLIGLSARTDAAGAEAVIAALPAFGKRGEIVRTPPGVLHLKSDCAPLGEAAVLSTARLAASGIFDGLEVQQVPEGEEPAANALRLNDHILIADGYPKTAEMLEKTGCAVTALPTAEIAKIDAGLSCLSLRWAD